MSFEDTTFDSEDPIQDGMTIREAFKWQASLLWARGLPAPTADEIADAMMKTPIVQAFLAGMLKT